MLTPAQVRPVIRILFARLAFVGLSLLATVSAYAHDDEPIWIKTPQELASLQSEIQQHREALMLALHEAMTVGVPVSSLTRPYNLDSNREVLNVPRSVLNRVVVSSLHLELSTTEMYLFCETGCETSIKQDLADHPESQKAVGLIRRLWPKMQQSFAILWRDIPVGIWQRTIYARSYGRTLAANFRYQANAYGPFSVLAGAMGFATAFGITEVAESMFMGPLHVVCKANYFWSVAFGTAIASLSRDLRTFLLFEKNGTSIFKRIGAALGNLRGLRADRKLEKRILFRTLVGEDGLEAFGKMTKHEAHSSLLEPLLDVPSARQAVATDALLWSEVTDALKTGIPRSSNTSLGQHRRLFETELELITNAKLSGNRAAAARWLDLNASLRSVLKIASNSVHIDHQLYPDRTGSLKRLGRLDLMLRTMDLFMVSWISKRPHDADSAKHAAAWLQEMMSEWMSMVFENSHPGMTSETLSTRLKAFENSLKAAIREGKPGAMSAEVLEKQDRYSDLVQKVDREVQSVRSRQCQVLFATGA